MATKALVLGGGGVAGIAWTTGLLLGLADHGVMLRETDTLIGTSAGSTVAAQIAGATPLDTLFQRQVEPALQTHEITPAPHLLALLASAFPVLMALGDPVERTRRIGRLALKAETPDEPTRRAVIAARLIEHQWPDRVLIAVAVDTASGETMRFNRHSGVALVDAVAASCAVPGIWPPVTIGAHRYMDGGIRSSDNADLAIGHDRVLVVSPTGGGTSLDEQVQALVATGASVHVIVPDHAAKDAIGLNPLSPDTRGPVAEAGRSQGKALAAEVGSFWTT